MDHDPIDVLHGWRSGDVLARNREPERCTDLEGWDEVVRVE
jgi:hypothetical protein